MENNNISIRKKVGRPSKLGDAESRLLDLISLGVPYVHACNAVGITHRTFNNWMNTGEQQDRGQYRDFYLKIKEAEAKGIAKHVKNIHLACEHDPKFSLQWLKCKYPQHFSEKRVEPVVDLILIVNHIFHLK